MRKGKNKINSWTRIVGAILLGTLALFGLRYLEKRKQIKAVNTHGIFLTDRSLSLLWSVGEVVSDTNNPHLNMANPPNRHTYNQQTIPLIAIHKKLFIYGGFDSLTFDLWELSPATGQTLSNESPNWTTLPFSFQNIVRVVHDSQKIFLAYDGRGKDSSMTFGAGGLAIYDPLEEEVINTQQVPATTETSYFLAGGHSAVIGPYLVDINQGTFMLEKHALPFSSNPVVLWYFQQAEGFVASEKMELWENNLSYINQTPIISKHKLIVKQGEPNGDDFYIKVFDQITGNELFSSQSTAISNAAVDNGFAYYLTNSNELVSMDISSGETKTLVEFSGELFKEINIRGYYVAADNNRIYVYLGDSRQLFAFARVGL